MKILLVLVLCVLVCAEGRGYWEWRPATTTPTESTPIVSWRSGQRYFTKNRDDQTWRAGEYQKSSGSSWRTAPATNTIDSSSQIQYWEPQCDFPHARCGMKSQSGLGAEFESAYTYVGYDYEQVMVVDATKAESSAARLITPYIKTHNREEICLHLQYLMQGEGIETMTVIQQDRLETRPVYTVSSMEKKGMWRLAKMDLVMREGISRYFIEVRLKSHVTGMFMIRELFYETGKCKRDSAQLMRRSRLMDKYWQLSGH